MPEGTTTHARAQPRATSRATTHMLKRGDWLKPGQRVTPGVPAFLHPLPPNADDSRLTFAKWLVDRKSPTTARAFVNRVWQAYFGTGIVATTEDFGSQGEPPSHPELLDWLAVEFMDRGWSIKQLHRLIVTSATYRQSSRVTPELYSRDPYNRLLARGPRFRVEGEIVRDIALAASGLLNPKVGGRSVMPPAPAFLFQPPASYAPFPWIEETGRGEIPPRPLHFPPPLDALSDAANLRRAQRRLLLRAPRPLEHAAAGADDAERNRLHGMRPGPGPTLECAGRRSRRRRASLARRAGLSPSAPRARKAAEAFGAARKERNATGAPEGTRGELAAGDQCRSRRLWNLAGDDHEGNLPYRRLACC